MMDALGWIETRYQKHRAFRYALIFFAFYAPLTYILGRLAKGKGWLNDFDALLCAGDYVRRGLSPYTLHPVCEGLNPAPYVYAPQWAEVLAPLIDAFGLMPIKAVYGLIYLAVLAFLAWYGLKSAAPRLPAYIRLMAFCLLTGSSIQSGNIGILCHAAVLLSALSFPKSRWVFLIAVVATSLIKPVMLTWLAVLLVDQRPLRLRIGYAAIGAIAGIAGYVLMQQGAGPLRGEWQSVLSLLVLNDQPGSSAFGWLATIGISGSQPFGLVLFGLYFIAILASAFLIAEWAAEGARERLIIGIAAAALLNPRLMDYDLFALPLSLALLPVFADALSPTLRLWVRNGFVGIYLLTLILNLLVLDGFKPAPFAILIMAALVLIMGVGLWRQNRQKLMTTLWWRGLL